MKAQSCECCLMPFAADPGQRTSPKYCSLCFGDGRLNAEGVALRDFQRVSYQGMRKRGVNALQARLFTFSIRFAPYWRSRQTR